MNITDIFRYPFKGLSKETLQAINLAPGLGIKGDRAFAITHGTTKFDHMNPSWVPRRNFLVVAHSPLLASILFIYDESECSVSFIRDNVTLLVVDLKQPNTDNVLNQFFEEYASKQQSGPFRLVSLGGKTMTDSQTPAVSIMNNRSLAELERKTGWRLDKERFRGNVWFDGDTAWEERSWVGKTINIGTCQIKITEEVVRCAAVDVDPFTGVKDLSVLNALNKQSNAVTFGVLGVVQSGGNLAVGDILSMNA